VLNAVTNFRNIKNGFRTYYKELLAWKEIYEIIYIAIMVTFGSIFTTLFIIDNDRNIMGLMNLTTLLCLSSIAIGGFFGEKIKSFRRKKNINS
jgi:hypothetical protein